MKEYQKLRDRQQQEFNALPLGYTPSDIHADKRLLYGLEKAYAAILKSA